MDPCKFWDVSYQYIGRALMSEHCLLPGVDPNKYPTTISDISGDFLVGVGTALLSDPFTLAAEGRWGEIHESDIPVGDKTIYRLREGIERFFITDINNAAASTKAQSTIVVMNDICWKPAADSDAQPSFNHVPGGGNVLYMDGHVQFIKYPGGYPVCPTWIAVIDIVLGM